MNLRSVWEMSRGLVGARAEQSVRVGTRRSFLRRAVVGAAAVPAVLGFASSARAGDPNVARNFQDIQQHENDHVDFLVGALGDAARPKPNFRNLKLTDFDQFIRLSQTFENTGSAAYLGAAPVLESRAYLAAAGSIALVEGRHAGWLNTYNSDPITLNVLNDAPSFEVPLTAEDVRGGVADFIKDLNGGPPIDYDSSPSADNDIAILNFALALEFLEAEFYNLNVPTFFK